MFEAKFLISKCLNRLSECVLLNSLQETDTLFVSVEEDPKDMDRYIWGTAYYRQMIIYETAYISGGV